MLKTMHRYAAGGGGNVQSGKALLGGKCKVLSVLDHKCLLDA